MPAFVSGLELSRRLYLEHVHPILEREHPGLRHAAGLLGHGSEVLGLDSELSTDHAWCPRMQLFLREEDRALREPLVELLAQQLPHRFLGYPLDTVDAPGEPGVFHMKDKAGGRVDHRVAVTTVAEFVEETLGWNPAAPLEAGDWLSFPSQLLLTLTAGAVHHDGVGELLAARERLTFYPRDVWLYLMAASWSRIGEAEHLLPRAGAAGDELGAAVIGAGLARDAMALAFLMERRYAPYPKWFGSAFSRLGCAGALAPPLRRALAAHGWEKRAAALGEACRTLARMHNALRLTDPLLDELRPFHGRPFMVIHGHEFAAALRSRIADPEVQRLAARGLLGGVDHFSDSAALKADGRWRPAVRALVTAGRAAAG